MAYKDKDTRKLYDAKNKDKRKAIQNKYYWKHHEEQLARHAKYRIENREKISASQTEYRAKNKEKLKSKNREYYKNNGERVRACARKSKMIRKYGITPEVYKDMFVYQEGACAICGTPPPIDRKLAVDHDHLTGKVRGLLCQKCNVVLGGANDSIEILTKAIKYLKDSGGAYHIDTMAAQELHSVWTAAQLAAGQEALPL